MVTGTRARSYDEMADALAAEGLPALQDKLSSLTPTDWERPTLLQPPDPHQPPWTVLQLAAHFDVFMGLTLGLVAEPVSARPVRRRSPRPWRRSGPRPRTPSGPASSGRWGWMSWWPPGWSRPGCTAWT